MDDTIILRLTLSASAYERQAKDKERHMPKSAHGDEDERGARICHAVAVVARARSKIAPFRPRERHAQPYARAYGGVMRADDAKPPRRSAVTGGAHTMRRRARGKARVIIFQPALRGIERCSP